ncbi:hypothetical protein BC943DRAFT_326671 [Umbelopsis sp. AD052]|nr:hypothetical protein BC943DRAFT_326671 [Umbelopsis sp. AD052]
MFAVLRQQIASNKQVRSFSSTGRNNLRFIFLVHDQTDEDALSRRLAVRQKHLEVALPDKRSGYIVTGGAILDSHDSKNMIGSSMVIEGNSEKEIWERLQNDIYCTGNVWDMRTAQLIPIVDGFKDFK